MVQEPPAGTSGHSTSQIGQDLGLNNPKAQVAAIEHANQLKTRKKAREAKVVSDNKKSARNKMRGLQRLNRDNSVDNDKIIPDEEEEVVEIPKENSSVDSGAPKSWEEMISNASPTSLKGLYVITGLVKQSMTVDAAGQAIAQL
jgi:hypothetical protein